MNFMDCKLVVENGRNLLKHKDISIEVPVMYLPAIQAGSMPAEVTFGIRPFYIDLKFEQSQHAHIPAEIFVVEPLGDMTVVTVVLSGGVRFQVVVPPSFTGRPKQSVWLGLDPNHILLFNKQTEKALPRVSHQNH
jgi:ABC-type sugar transport system ATPase subunit